MLYGLYSAKTRKKPIKTNKTVLYVLYSGKTQERLGQLKQILLQVLSRSARESRQIKVVPLQQKQTEMRNSHRLTKVQRGRL